MKVFDAPEVEIVRLVQDDIVATSICTCVDCTSCEPGSNDCSQHDMCVALPQYANQN